MTGDTIAFLDPPSANDALRALMEDYCAAVIEAGMSAINVDAEDLAEVERLAGLMRRSEIKFAVTWLGVRQDLAFEIQPSGERVSAFELSGVPLVKIHGDIPAYYRFRHRDVPRNSASLYQADEFLTYRRMFMPEAQTPSALLPPMPMLLKELGDADLRQRARGKLVFQKNGNSAPALVQLWRDRLSPSLSTMLCELADAVRAKGLLPGRLDVGNLVLEYLRTELRVDVPGNNTIAFFTAQIDDYLRRIKSTMIAEALLEFPVIVQGSFWDHVDFRGKAAIHAPGEAVQANLNDVEQRLGVIDMSPNTDTWPHDRIQRAAGAYSLALTNEQSWLARDFPEFMDLTFRFEVDSIKDVVARTLRDPVGHVERAIAFADAFRKKHPRSNFVERLMRMADLATLHHNPDPPMLQPYFAWG